MYEEYENNSNIEDKPSIYVISINSVPYFYEEDLQIAQDKLLIMAQLLHEKNRDYNNSYIRHDNSNELKVIRNLDFIIYSYEYVLDYLSIDEVKKYKVQN